MFTFDNPLGNLPSQATFDSAGVFLIGQLERLDQTLYEPLIDFTWSRDITLRTDVSMATDLASWRNLNYARTGGITPGGISWVGQGANAIAGVALDAEKKSQPMHPWALELKYDVFELAKSAELGQPVDSLQYDAMQMGWNSDVNQLVYVGDTQVNSTGLVNGAAVTNVSNVANGATSGSTNWDTKKETEVLADVNELLTSAWAASAYKYMPTELRLPPMKFSSLVTRLVSGNGSQSILSFIAENNIITRSGGTLNIQPLNFLIGRGLGGTPFQLGTVDRMMAYTNRNDLVRFPLVPLLRTPLEQLSIYQCATYYGKLGQVEFLRPETIAYRDGI